jgi:hypothetical protein
MALRSETRSSRLRRSRIPSHRCRPPGARHPLRALRQPGNDIYSFIVLILLIRERHQADRLRARGRGKRRQDALRSHLPTLPNTFPSDRSDHDVRLAGGITHRDRRKSRRRIPPPRAHASWVTCCFPNRSPSTWLRSNPKSAASKSPWPPPEQGPSPRPATKLASVPPAANVGYPANVESNQSTALWTVLGIPKWGS